MMTTTDINTNIMNNNRMRIIMMMVQPLDPTIRMLLSTVQQYQNLMSNSSSISTSQNNNNKRKLIELLNVQCDLLHRLHQMFQTIGSTLLQQQQQSSNNNSNSMTTPGTSAGTTTTPTTEQQQKQQTQIHKQFHKIMDYISLPILAILKGTNLDWILSGDDDLSNDKNDLNLIVQSSKWKCVAVAASTYQYLVTDIVIGVISATSTSTSSDSSTTLLSIDLIVRTLVACTTALPSGPDIVEMTMAESQQQQQQQSSSTKLDRGDNCLMALLELIEVLVLLKPISTISITSSSSSTNTTAAATTTTTTTPLSRAISEMMNGALVARIADCCVTIIKPLPSSPSDIVDAKKNNNNSTHKPRPLSINVQVRANTTLNNLIQGVPYASVWQMSFPGCFSGLYRCIMNDISSTAKSKSNTDLVVGTIRTLTLLLRTTLPLIKTPKKKSTKRQSTGESSVTAALTNRLTLLAKQANQEHSSSSTKKSNSSSSSSDKSSQQKQQQLLLEDRFLQQVRTRIPPPLLVMVRLLCVASKNKIRFSAIQSLYRALLVEIRNDCWYKPPDEEEQEGTGAGDTKDGGSSKNNNNNNNIQMSVIESCLILTNDTDHDVADAARELLQQRLALDDDNLLNSDAAAGGDKIIITSLIIDRTTSILLELPTLAQRQLQQQHVSGGEVELRTKLKLLKACLSLQFDDVPSSSVPTTTAVKKRTTSNKKRNRSYNKSFLRSIVCAGGEVSAEIRKVWISILDVTFLMDTSSSSAITVISSNNNNYPPCCPPPDGPKMRYMQSKETYDVAFDCIHSFGKALGAKHAALVVDSIIADFYEAAQKQQNRGADGDKQQQRQHRRMGRRRQQQQPQGYQHDHVNQAEWIHEWIGSLVMAKGVLLGAFGGITNKDSKGAAAATAAGDSNNNKQQEKEERRRRRILSNLSASVLPVLVTCIMPLFDLSLPTSSEQQHKANSSSSNGNIDIKLLLKLQDEQAASSSSPKSTTSFQLQQQQTARGNATVTYLLLDLVTAFFDLLVGDDYGKEGESTANVLHTVLPTCLYPILEKAAISTDSISRMLRTSSSSVLICSLASTIQQMAAYTLYRLAMAVYLSSSSCSSSSVVNDLIVDNLSLLTSTMLVKVRIPGGRTLSPNSALNDDVLTVVSVVTYILQLLSVSKEDQKQEEGLQFLVDEHRCLGSRIDSNKLDCMYDLVLDLTSHFDQRSSRRTSDYDDETATAMTLLDLFESALLCLLSSYGISSSTYTSAPSAPVINNSNASEAGLGEDEPSWYKLLEPFRRHPGGSDTDDDPLLTSLSPREGFEEYHRNKQNTINTNNAIETTSEEEDKKKKPPKMNLDYNALNRDVRFVDILLSRCCYLLSNPSLKVQVKSCSCLIYGFTFLGWLETNVPGEDETENGKEDGEGSGGNAQQPIKTSVLRQIHSTWSAISSRMKATTASIVAPTSSQRNSSSLLVVNEFGAPPRSSGSSSTAHLNIAQQRIFLSKMFTLVSIMTLCCGDDDDFMGRLLNETVWPCIGRIVKVAVDYDNDEGFDAKKKFDRSRNNQRNLQLAPPPPNNNSNVLTAAATKTKTTHNKQKKNHHYCYSDSEKHLLKAVMNCLARVYGGNSSSSGGKIGSMMAGQIPTMGTMLLPFLDCGEDDDNDLYGPCYVALQNMIMIDCDALWRPLTSIVGRHQYYYQPSCCPLLSLKKTNKQPPPGWDDNVDDASSSPQSSLAPNNNKLAVAAQKLLDFIETLPEQPLE